MAASSVGGDGASSVASSASFRSSSSILGDGADDSLQANVLNFMGRPEAYALLSAAVDRIETHASIVFLAGDYAYKVKKAVKYPFLDFSTLARRRAACLNELRVNARTAPGLYLRVVPVLRGPGDGFRFGAEGTSKGLSGDEAGGDVVEWVLVMRRFDQEALLHRMAEEGRLPLAMMAPLATVIADFHSSADRFLAQDVPARSLAGVLADNASVFAAHPELFPAEDAIAFAESSLAALTVLVPLLKARARDGYVRHCHGDLHLRNIVEIDRQPVLFDAIEFDDALATIDVLYDLAFLLIDLGRHGLRGHANAVLNAYLDREGSTGNLLGLALLPLYLSTRAAIRAKVELLRALSASPDEAAPVLAEVGDYFDLARSYLAPPPPCLVVIGGLSGSGKSALSRASAAQLGGFPGAIHIRSDVERKRMFGVGAEVRLPERAYTSEVSDLVYRMCRKRARLALAAGHSVVLDGVHARPDERSAVRELAETFRVSFTGLWLEADPAILKARVAKRLGDVSDATPDVVEEQLAYDLGVLDFVRVDAGKPLEHVVKSCLAVIGGADAAR
ncbi:MAG: AAA family ATPase [Methyloceanibacter sp.]|uniref:bifunctional aminoglycoside phosphotransferase/ATP-binding protein n=1 Tax=Methyloceanibacter sp. TaxID=1965321 RepID=UPI003D9AFCEC